jgi:MoaA/NifB/PqqE/SkfB family radical SAM enzyme
MFKVSDIKRVHLEISSVCNARCPGCPRNLFGYPFNNGYIEHNMSLDEAKTIFKDIIKQLTHIRINGNFGDAVSNNSTPDIVEWMLEENSGLNIVISTNGSAQNKRFWERLGKTGITVEFDIDGFEGTHELYRQDTNFNKIITNSKIFIDSGGIATGKFIDLGYNSDQFDDLRKMLLGIGFQQFKKINNPREDFSSYDKNGNLVFILNRNEPTIFKELETRKSNDLILEDIINDKRPCQCINCEVKQSKEIYIGDVYPCCFLGFEPKTYGKGKYHQAANAQFNSWLTKNNALKYSIHECITWFSQVEDSWNKKTFEEGRLVICNDVCGVDNV